MGNYIGTDMTWYVYRRSLSTDAWVPAPLQTWGGISEDDALSQFKHEIFTFALGKHTEYEDTKSIYLYRGSTRIVKAHLDPETKQVEVWSPYIRQLLSVEESLAAQRYPKHEKLFFSKYLTKYAWINPQTITFVHKD